MVNTPELEASALASAEVEPSAVRFGSERSEAEAEAEEECAETVEASEWASEQVEESASPAMHFSGDERSLTAFEEEDEVGVRAGAEQPECGHSMFTFERHW